GWIELDFPATPATSDAARLGPMTVTAELAAVVGAPVLAGAASKFDLLVELESEEVVRALNPDIARLAELPVRGVIVTARASTPGFDFVSRFFAPRVGIDEDPVCGSAHCCLGPYWGERLGKTDLVACQASARGGVVRVGLRGGRVRLAGQAVTVLRGELA